MSLCFSLESLHVLKTAHVPKRTKHRLCRYLQLDSVRHTKESTINK